MPKVNVAGALAAGRQFHTNPFDRSRFGPSAGEIQAKYDLQASHIVAQGIQQIGSVLASIPNMVDSMNLKKEQLEGAKMENAILKQKAQSTNNLLEQSNQVLTSLGIGVQAADPIQIKQDISSVTTAASNGIAGADNAKIGVDPVVSTGVGLTEGELPRSVPKLSNEQSFQVVADYNTWSQNGVSSLTEFKNKINQNGDINQIRNPEEYVINASIDQGNTVVPGVSPDGRLTATFVARVPDLDANGNEQFEVVDGKQILKTKEQSVTKYMSQFDGTNKWYSPLQPRTTLRAEYLKASEKTGALKAALRGTGKDSVITIEKNSAAANELTNYFNERIENDPLYLRDMEANFKGITGNSEFKLTDQNGDGIVNGEDLTILSLPTINGGRMTFDQYNQREGQRRAQIANAQQAATTQTPPQTDTTEQTQYQQNQYNPDYYVGKKVDGRAIVDAKLATGEELSKTQLLNDKVSYIAKEILTDEQKKKYNTASKIAKNLDKIIQEYRDDAEGKGLFNLEEQDKLDILKEFDALEAGEFDQAVRVKVKTGTKDGKAVYSWITLTPGRRSFQRLFPRETYQTPEGGDVDYRQKYNY